MSSIILLSSHQKESTLIEKARIIRQLKLDRDRAVKAYDEMKKTIINEMGDITEILDSDGCELITYKEHTENRFNSKKFCVDFADIYESYKEQNVVRNFIVK